MRRIITTIKTVDSPLLALTGFDALEAEMLSRAYSWELEQSGNTFFVSKAEKIFEDLGGRNELTNDAGQFLNDLFVNDQFEHSRVTSNQDRYNVYFGDGSVQFNGSPNKFRILSRLKSVGATAKKIHALYNKTELLETPIDIIGVTLIAKDKEEMSLCLRNLFIRLSNLSIDHVSSPSRREEVHVKGRADFLAMFGKNGLHSDIYTLNDLSVKDEPCTNGYEAVKLTIMYTKSGKSIPIEIQVTHETARKESRVGLGSHTLFKLMKLAKDAGGVSISKFSDTELLNRLQKLSIRKQKFDKTSYETNGDSTLRANATYHEIVDQQRSAMGSVAIRS